MSIFVLLELPLEVIMSGHIKWNRVSRGVIISMLLLITMGCGHNMRIENSVEQNTVEIQKVEDHAGTIVLPEGQFYEIIKNNPIDQDYKWEDTGVEDRIERAGKCYQAWCAEIENSLNHLQVYLDSEDYEQLYSSYIGWMECSASSNQYIMWEVSIWQVLILPEAVLLILLLWRSRQDGRENMRSS